MLHRLSIFALLFSLALYAVSLTIKFFTDSNIIVAEFVFLGACYNALAASVLDRLIWSARRRSAGSVFYAMLFFLKLPLALVGLYAISKLGNVQLMNTLVGILSFMPMIFLHNLTGAANKG